MPDKKIELRDGDVLGDICGSPMVLRRTLHGCWQVDSEFASSTVFGESPQAVKAAKDALVNLVGRHPKLWPTTIMKSC